MLATQLTAKPSMLHDYDVPVLSYLLDYRYLANHAATLCNECPRPPTLNPNIDTPVHFR